VVDTPLKNSHRQPCADSREAARLSAPTDSVGPDRMFRSGVVFNLRKSAGSARSTLPLLAGLILPDLEVRRP